MSNDENLSPLKIKDLSVKYGDFYAVKNLSLELKKGEIFGLLGPNGAGKTSAISTLVTLEKPSSGEIWILDANVLKDPIKAKGYVGYVPQEVINHGYFSVYEILKFHSGYFGCRNNEKQIDYLLKELGLWEHKDKRVKQLSGGMKRRLLIAKALVHKPALVILDEPTAGVDIELRTSLWEFVRRLRAEGTTILLTTHYLEEAEALCDRVAVIHRGQILRIGNTKELIQELTFRRITLELFSEIPPVDDEFLILQNEKELVFSLPSANALGSVFKKLGESLKAVKDIHIEEGNLEDAFLNILQSQSAKDANVVVGVEAEMEMELKL